MQIDELRGELATLADEIPPFDGDVSSLHRRERRRRVVGGTLAGALAVVITISVVVVTRHDGTGKVHVSGKPSKEVPSAQISHIDAIVVPATPGVKAALDASASVEKYAFIPRADRSSSSLLRPPDLGLCALQTSDGYAVDAMTPGTKIQAGLQHELAGRGTVYDVSDRFGIDFEIFLKVDASATRSRSLAAALKVDPDLYSVRHLSKADAYALFKDDFADQPALVAGTKPSDLPESFRVIVRPGRAVPTAIRRYASKPGVDTVITPGSQFLFDPAAARPLRGKPVSPCATG